MKLDEQWAKSQDIWNREQLNALRDAVEALYRRHMDSAILAVGEEDAESLKPDCSVAQSVEQEGFVAPPVDD